MNGLRVYDTTYIKAKSGTYGGKVYTSFPSLNVPEDAAVCHQKDDQNLRTFQNRNWCNPKSNRWFFF